MVRAHLSDILGNSSALQDLRKPSGRTTPLVVRQYPRESNGNIKGLETVTCRSLAEWNPKGVITRSSNSKPQRDAMLEFIERQVDVGERRLHSRTVRATLRINMVTSNTQHNTCH